MATESLTPKKVLDLQTEGRMDPDTFAELMRPWQSDGRSRGPALVLYRRDRKTFVPAPIKEDYPPGNMEETTRYLLRIMGEHDGISFDFEVMFVGPKDLLDDLDWEWKTSYHRVRSGSYFGAMTFRGSERHLVDPNDPEYREYVPVTVELACITSPTTAASPKPPTEGNPKTLERNGGIDPH